MPSRFITELTSEMPQVLLISDETISPEPMGKIWQAHQLGLKTLSPSDAVALTQQAALERAYKIVWWVSENQDNSQALVKSLQKYQAKVFVVGFCSSGIFYDQAVSRLTEIKRQLPQATLVIGRDVVQSESLVSPAILANMLEQVDAGTLRDPGLPLYLQTLEAFSRTLATKLLKPRLTSMEVQGKKTTSTVMAKLLNLSYQRLFGVQLAIRERPTTAVIDQSSLPTEVNLFPESSEQIAQELTTWLQRHPPTKAKLVVPEFPPAPQLSPIPDSPSAPPVPIEPVATASMTTSEPMPVKVVAENQVGAKPVLASPPPPTASLPRRPAIVPPPVTSAASPTPETLGELESDITELFKEYRTEHKTTHLQKLSSETRTTKRHSLRKERMFWIGMIGFAILAAIMTFFGFFWLTLFQLKHQVAIADQTIQTAPQTSTSQSQTSTDNLTDPNIWVKLAKAQVTLYAPLLAPLGLDDASTIIGFSENVDLLQIHQQALQQNSRSLFLAMMNRYPVDVATQLATTLHQSQSVYQDISLAQSYLKDINSDVINDEALQRLKSHLNTTKKAVATIQELQPILGDLIGFSGKRTYAVVFQNSQELRATGGVIQSVGFVTIDHGLVVDTQALSAAQIDQQITGIALPPDDVARYLGGNRWHFEDVAWDPDAVVTSKEILLFLEKATRYNVDGVVLVNTNSLQSWLQAIGPVDIPQYQEEVTDKNLNQRLEAHSELQVNGDQTQDYSTLLLKNVLLKTTQTSEAKVADFYQTIFDQAEANQLTFYLRRPTESAVFDAIGWTGALLSPDCPSQLQQENCIVDPVAEVESNVGINKANLYLDRKVSDAITIKDGVLQHDRKIILNNTSVSNAWPRGTYKTFVRLFVSPQATLDSIWVNGQRLDPKHYQIMAENDRLVFGAYVEVPIQQSVTLEFVYNQLVNTDGPFSYAMLNQFQSGITPPLFNVTITTPNHRPQLIAPQAQAHDSQIIFNSPTTLDALLGVKYE